VTEPCPPTPPLGAAAIYNAATLTVSDSTLSGNSATEFGGGGIANGGTLTVSNSTLSGNTADYGSAILNYALLTVRDSTLSDNTATDFGGGIANFGTLTIRGKHVAS